MMWVAIMVWVCIAVVAGLTVISSWQDREERALRAVLTADAAFDEKISVPPDPDQLERLKPMIGQLGLTRAPASADHGVAPDAFTVWICDSLGATHDVWTGYSEAEAAKIARQFARRLKMPISDPEHILDGLPIG